MKVKVGDYVGIKNRDQHTDPRYHIAYKVIQVTGTDVYIEHPWLTRGARYEHEMFERTFSPYPKLERLLRGLEDESETP